MAISHKLLRSLLIAGCCTLIAVGCGGGGAAVGSADNTLAAQSTDDAEIAAIAVMVLVP
jgi:hypothetical protein